MKFRTGALRALCSAALSALLASCGGESLVPFNPARILVFGDEASVIDRNPPANGRKYTVNYEDDSGQVDCSKNQIWVQLLAVTGYAISFPECPLPVDTTKPAGLIRAIAGATAGGTADIDLTAQITRQLALPAADGGGITSTDLVTVFAGVNDVVAAFERFKAGGSGAEAVAQAEAAGDTLAAQVNRIAAAGGRVIVSTVPNVCLTPYGVANRTEPVCVVDESHSELLTLLTARLNARLLVTINNNGREIGLIELNPYLISVVANPLAYGYVDVENAACVPLDTLACTSKTLKPDASATTWLWASQLQLSPQGHAQLGNLALSRAKNQPFQ